MKAVKAFKAGRDMIRDAGAKTIGKLGKGVTIAKEVEFHLSIVDRRQQVKDRGYLEDPFVDDIAAEWNNSNRRPKKRETLWRGTWDIPFQGVIPVEPRDAR